MEITCPECDFSRTVDAARVPDRPVKVTCPKCRREFTFDRREKPSVAAEQPAAPAERIACPACGLEQPAGETCGGCGVIYARFRARQEAVKPSAVAAAEHQETDLEILRRQTVGQAPQDIPKAGFWIRVVAYLLDSTLLGVVQFVLSLTLGMTVSSMGGLTGEGDTAMNVVVWLFGATLSIAYAVFFTGYCGQTPGKMALRIKVIRTDGRPLTYGRAALREVLGKFLSSILLGIGYLMVAFDNQKQGLHDRIGDTYVIKL